MKLATLPLAQSSRLSMTVDPTAHYILWVVMTWDRTGAAFAVPVVWN